MHELEKTARALVAEGKGILAADESDGTIKKRFDSIGVESTEENRRAYRELLFTTEGAEEYISGVILFDETIRQSASDGTPFPQLLESSRGSSPGSRSTRARSRSRCAGRDDHRGARRAARAARRVPRARRALREVARDLLDRRRTCRASTASGRTRTRSRATPRSARRPGSCRSSSPRCCRTATHTLEQSAKATGRVLQAVYTELHDQRVDFRGTLLKPNMVLSGYEASERAGVDEVAEATLELLLPARPGGGARDRLPLRRPVRRGRDGAPERDERAAGRNRGSCRSRTAARCRRRR